MSGLEFCKRLDAALARRKGAASGEYKNVKCEVCGDNMRIYRGPSPGVICTNCIEPSGEGQCVRISPLAITRGTLNEHGH